MEVAKDEASLPQSARILHSIQRGIRRVKFPNILQLANVSRLAQTLKKKNVATLSPWLCFQTRAMMMTDPWKWARLLHSRSHTKTHKMLFRFFFSFLNMWRVLCEQFKLFSSHPHPIFFFWVNKELNQWPVETNENFFFFSFWLFIFLFCVLTWLQQCVAFGVFMLNGRAVFFFFPPT